MLDVPEKKPEEGNKISKQQLLPHCSPSRKRLLSHRRQEETHRRVDLELVRLSHFVVQLPYHRHDATAAVDGKEIGRRLEGVKHAASCPLVRIRGVHYENWSAHWCILEIRKKKKIKINVWVKLCPNLFSHQTHISDSICPPKGISTDPRTSVLYFQDIYKLYSCFLYYSIAAAIIVVTPLQ